MQCDSHQNVSQLATEAAVILDMATPFEKQKGPLKHRHMQRVTLLAPVLGILSLCTFTDGCHGTISDSK